MPKNKAGIIIIFILPVLIFLNLHVLATDYKHLDFIGTKPLKGDTAPSVELLNRFDWSIQLTDDRGLTRKISGFDSINQFNPKQIDLSTQFWVNPALRGNVNVLQYKFHGSILISLNNKPILATGSFAPENDKAGLYQNGYADFLLGDSVEIMKISYIPAADKGFDRVRLVIGTTKWAAEKKVLEDAELAQNYALSFYYLAFAVVFFIIFLFFRDITENLYFALFCFSVFFSLLSNNLDFAEGSSWQLFLPIFSIEFLSIFLARVLVNKSRSKIYLALVAVIIALCYLPAIQNFNIGIGDRNPPFLVVIMVVLLFMAAGFSSIYYLVQGFGQKKWEAKAITIGFSIGMVLAFIGPFIVSIFAMPHTYFDYINTAGLSVFPLTVAFVLGRRNGLNQIQLTNQLKSIEKLSSENLVKEKEKQQILANQNIELEEKVNERTAELLHQKQIVELKNTEITDSINYAKRIQSAILPDIELIYKVLENSFILYAPKDIVSGDFYVFAEKNEHVVIAAGDCTGHGVSGAMMSMIGSSYLNQIVNENGVTTPSLILDELNLGLIDAFKKNVNESQHHIEAAICSFDKAKAELQYAGAMRPLWLIRNGDVLLLKPDKFQAGNSQQTINKTFSNQVVKLQKDDSIYIFTDGFADQFGGEQNRKLMTTNFKSMLLQIQHMSMRKQEIHLKEFFENWKGKNEQVDDVLVIGIRV